MALDDDGPIEALGVAATAKALDIGRATLYEMIRAGEAPRSFLVGRRRLFPVAEIRKWLVERVDVVWHYLRYGRELRLDNVDWSATRIATMLRKRIDKLRAAEAEPGQLTPNESILCNWCYYWDVCPAKQGQTHPTRLAE